ncbi:MAG: hypothetical protein RBS57_04220 [Desulforhabdus sp.]|nr:hypothetical protein [Desulforhabdus sp.]
MNYRFEQVDKRFERLDTELKDFKGSVDKRFEQVDYRFELMDKHLDKINAAIDRLTDKWTSAMCVSAVSQYACSVSPSPFHFWGCWEYS